MTFVVNESSPVDAVQTTLSRKASNLRVHLTTMRGVLGHLRTAVGRFEQAHLDPLFDRALDLWAGKAGIDQRRQQTLVTSLTGASITAEERALNRGIYLSASALGAAVIGSFYPPLRLFGFAAMLYNSRAIYVAAYRDLVQEQTVSMNVLTALINTAYLGGGLLLWGSIAQLSFFFSARLLTVIQDRFIQDITAAFTLHDQRVWQVLDGETVQVRLETLQVGDRVVVQAGEVIPVDGTVKEGLAQVDQQVLTGEAKPVEKSSGDAVMAMTLVVSGRIIVSVDKTSSETTAAQVGQLLQETMDLRSQRQIRAVRLTDRLVLPTVLLSAVSLPWIGPLRSAALLDVHPQRHLINLGTLSNLSFLLYANRRNILIKDGRTLEILNEVDTVIFDKTGTLTEAQPQIAAIHPCGQWRVEDLLARSAAAEQHQDHPIARALLAEASARQIPLAPIEEATYRVGFGLTVQIAGEKVQVGSIRFIEQEEIAVPAAIRRVIEVCRVEGHSLIFVAVDGCLMGAIELRVNARSEAKAVVESLRQHPRIPNIIVVSGDQTTPTAALAQAMGIGKYVAEALPSDKAALIAELQAAGRTVCFIGDGINDAVALKQADVSVSLHGATTAATQTAHVVLMEQDLQQLLLLFQMAQEYRDNQRDLTAAVMTPGLVGALGIYLLGFGLPQMTLLDLLDTVLGISIAMRPWLRQRRLAQPADSEFHHAQDEG